MSFLKEYSLALALLISTIFILHSYKKDYGKADEQSIEKLSNWYQSKTKVSKSSSFSKLSP